MGFLVKYAKPIIWAVVALCVVVAGVLLYLGGWWAGGDGVEAEHARKQLEVNEQLRKADAKIDRAAPDGSDKRTAIEWLQQYTRQ